MSEDLGEDILVSGAEGNVLLTIIVAHRPGQRVETEFAKLVVEGTDYRNVPAAPIPADQGVQYTLGWFPAGATLTIEWELWIRDDGGAERLLLGYYLGTDLLHRRILKTFKPEPFSTEKGSGQISTA
jgi:hypothetical protein